MSDKKPTIIDWLGAMDQSELRLQILSDVLDGKQTVRKDGAVMLRFATMATSLDDLLAGRRNALVIWGDSAAFEAARQKMLSAAPRTEGET